MIILFIVLPPLITYANCNKNAQTKSGHIREMSYKQALYYSCKIYILYFQALRLNFKHVSRC